ncbi:4-hydroxythreonine-4-phosphate dehydrogenase PdxA [Desulfospira joergensenii]|uniref:4-hydroxythreonine-4-phosphate dehydrogenase PdxA n=1 Tax=Desulfospira joergensenii TaxID=53329 RepID=UPI0003B6751E|nr:4-hydroxythreonine-4-phosphate dehydrogenase PdxA [Desulfospira joergensenii]
MTPFRPIIGITMGDPLGIGPEILIKTLNDPRVYSICRPLVLGDAGILDKALVFSSVSMDINCPETPDQGLYEHQTLDVLNLSDLNPDILGLTTPTAETGRAMENYIIKGVDLAVKNQIAALVTCPITKTGLKLAGSQFHGHTELIAEQTHTKEFAMMLAGKSLRVVLVTIHMPISQVPGALSSDAVLRTIRLTRDSLKTRFGIPEPRIGVAGLNPHAGEDSMFGEEEKNIISPAVGSALKEGIDVKGPLPPDTIFYHAVQGAFDAAICMYHDQGLIPFKLVHFKDGVNTTLGLPIIRTSVDHGTAYDIAWKGKADPSSLMEAVKMAVVQAGNQLSGN